MTTSVRPTRVADVPRPLALHAEPRPLSLHADLKGLARRLGRSVQDLTVSESQLLRDLQRDRYPMRALDQLVTISARSPLVHHRHGLEATIRAHVVSRSTPLTLVRDDVLDFEDHSNSAADVAMRRWERVPSLANWQAAKEAMAQQHAASAQALDYLNANPPRPAA